MITLAPGHVRGVTRLKIRRATESLYDRMDSVYDRLRAWPRHKRLWWRYRYIPGAAYPPHMRDDSRFSWRADLRVALTNPPRHP